MLNPKTNSLLLHIDFEYFDLEGVAFHIIVDDVFSTGLNVEAVIDRLQSRLKRNMPADVRVAIPYYKPASRKTARVPDYYLYECNEWQVLPYELDGLTEVELAMHKPAAARLIKPT